MTLMTSGIAKKNGGTPEGARQGNHNMLSVTEKPEKASLLSRVGGDFVTASPDKRAADWLEQQVAKSRDKIITVVADLTPALARVMLNRNDGNRKISETVVDAYARDVSNASWLLNGEPIIVAKDGHLNDGQHRCAAVVKADRAITVLMAFGFDRATQTTLDQGKMRSIGDYLSMRGYTNSLRLGAAANFALQALKMNRVNHGGKGRATKSEILEFVETTPEIIASVEVCEQRGADAIGGRALIAFIHWMLWKRSGRKNADTFINALISGVNLPAKHPILYARSRLINERARLRPEHRAELIFKAWNAWRRNVEIQRLEISGGPLPKLEK
jgi:hypothetical protein